MGFSLLFLGAGSAQAIHLPGSSGIKRLGALAQSGPCGDDIIHQQQSFPRCLGLCPVSARFGVFQPLRPAQLVLAAGIPGFFQQGEQRQPQGPCQAFCQQPALVIPPFLPPFPGKGRKGNPVEGDGEFQRPACHKPPELPGKAPLSPEFIPVQGFPEAAPVV